MSNQNLEIVTILSNRTKEGMVELRLNGELISQWEVSKAKEIHRMLGEAIEAAISDTLIYRFLREMVGLSDEAASGGLIHFRELRQGSKGTVYPT